MKRSPFKRKPPRPKRKPDLTKRLGRSVAPTRLWRSNEYKAWVRTHPCIVCGQSAQEAHHIRETLPRTMGVRVGDEWCVPMCKEHHDALHANSRTFWDTVAIDPQNWAVKARHGHPLWEKRLRELAWS